MKKVLLINNFGENFGSELASSLQAHKAEVLIGEASDFLLDLGDGHSHKPKLVSMDGPLSLAAEDIVFCRNRKPLTFHSTLLLQFVELFGAKSINQKFKEHYGNIAKQSQYINLVKNSFRIPRTILVPEKSWVKFSEYISSEFTFPIVMKGRGSCGKTVWKVNSIDEIDDILSSFDQKSREKTMETIIFQEYIENSHEEYRAVCMFGEILAIVVRSSDNFLNNHAQGGSVSTKVLSDDEARECLRAADNSGLDYLGVDFMKDENGNMIFLELQTGPSLSVSKIVNENILEDMARLLMEK